MTQDVVIGYLHGDDVTSPFHHCLFRTFIHDLCGPRRILNFVPVYSNVNIGGPRNQIVRDFLDTEGGEWLWMLDTDATFPADLLHNLLAVADPLEAPIVGALTHRLRSTGELDEQGMPAREIVPVAYQQIKSEAGEWVGYRELTLHSGDGLLEVDATGCHCLLVHRSVFEELRSEHPYPWFRETVLASGITAGEDITFCLAARDAGFPIWIDTRLEAGHVKPFVMTSKGAR